MSESRTRVQVIATFALDGKMQPLYVAHEGYTRKILSSYISHEDFAWITFKCSIQVEDTVRSITLNYSIKDHLWDMIYTKQY